MGATTHSIEKFPSSSGNRAQWSVRYTWVYGTENITGSLHLNNIFSNVRPGHRFVTNNRRMSVLSEKILKMNGAKAFHQMAFSMAK
jgi:hypothetical protein